MSQALPLASSYAIQKFCELDTAVAEATPRVRDHADDEAIHDLRVAIRRLRTMLKMTRSLFGRWHSDVVRHAFATVMRATGELRDEEVLEQTLAEATNDPSFSRWVKARSVREKNLRHAVVAHIEHGELYRARLLLKAMLVFHVDPKLDMDLSRFSRRAVEKARRNVEQRRDVEITNVVGLHELRIAYKELRYAIELLAEALPLDARALLEPSAVFQKRLGEIHDVDMAILTVTRAHNLKAQVKGSALMALQQAREKRVTKYLRELDPLGSAAREASASEQGELQKLQEKGADQLPSSPKSHQA
jgi:CHAD domain-containing protein